MKIESTLKRALQANGVFSGLTGLISLLAGGQIAVWLGVTPAALVTSTGASLLGFALCLFWIAARAESPPALIRTIIGLDLAWVLGSAILILAGVFSSQGALLMGGIALVVLAMAAAQFLGLRAARR